jgi:TctA family transporter
MKEVMYYFFWLLLLFSFAIIFASPVWTIAKAVYVVIRAICLYLLEKINGRFVVVIHRKGRSSEKRAILLKKAIFSVSGELLKVKEVQVECDADCFHVFRLLLRTTSDFPLYELPVSAEVHVRLQDFEFKFCGFPSRRSRRFFELWITGYSDNDTDNCVLPFRRLDLKGEKDSNIEFTTEGGFICKD